MVLAGKDNAAQEYLRQSLQQEKDESPQGEVYLVGAGPEILIYSLSGPCCSMQQADVVVYDRLVSPAILDMVRRDAT